AEFYDALLQGDAVTVGLAIQQTAERVKDDPGARENMITYNLLGDPAMKVAGLTGQGRGVSGFAQWRWAIFSPDQLTNDAVSGVHGSLGDKDGANFLHYALGTTPGGPVKPEDVDLWDAVDEEGFVFKARRRALGRDIVYRLRVSEDLENWQDDPVDVETLSVEQDPGGETETVRMRVNRPNAKRLYIGRKFIYEP
ncbi:MAG: hypothetical protein ACO398_07315, partial [Kiritimatiellia bacterium]